MKTKNMIAIATLTMAFTGTVLAQGHPEIDKIKGRRPVQTITSPRDAASGQATGKSNARRRKSPAQEKLGNFDIQLKQANNNAGTGTATQKNTQNKLGNFEIQDIKSPRDAASGQATGITSPRDAASGLPTGKRQHKPLRQALVNNEVIKDANVKQLQPGNSGGTITNQRSRRPNRRK